MRINRLSGVTLILLTTLAPAVCAENTREFVGTPGVSVTMTASYIDIHTGPGRGYPVFHVAEKYDTLRLIKRRTDWYKVATTDGKTGWVPRAKLESALSADGAAPDFSATGSQKPPPDQVRK